MRSRPGITARGAFIYVRKQSTRPPTRSFSNNHGEPTRPIWPCRPCLQCSFQLDDVEQSVFADDLGARVRAQPVPWGFESCCIDL